MLRRKISNLRRALRATIFLIREEESARTQLFFACSIFLLSWIFHISRFEIVLLILTVGIVFTVEAINTALEEAGDLFTHELDSRVGRMKDLGAAASFIFGVVCLIIVCIIFVPRIFMLL